MASISIAQPCQGKEGTGHILTFERLPKTAWLEWRRVGGVRFTFFLLLLHRHQGARETAGEGSVGQGASVCAAGPADAAFHVHPRLSHYVLYKAVHASSLPTMLLETSCYPSWKRWVESGRHRSVGLAGTHRDTHSTLGSCVPSWRPVSLPATAETWSKAASK